MTQDHAWLADLIGPCPQCGNGQMAVVVDARGATNLLCRDCVSCWHADFEWTGRVDPVTCPGCPARDLCRAASRSSRLAVPLLT